MSAPSFTAVFGGSFDPPHRGHEQAILDVLRLPGVQRVVLLPTPSSPLKKTQTPIETRLQWIRTAWGHLENVIIDETEIEWARQHPGQLIYSIQSIPHLQKKYGEIAWVIGTDQLIDLPRWHRFPELVRACHWIVLERRGVDTSAAHRALQSWGLGSALSHFRFFPTNAQEISSTQIREAWVRTGSPPAEMVPSALMPELLASGFYGSRR